jgi:hypothetical protein
VESDGEEVESQVSETERGWKEASGVGQRWKEWKVRVREGKEAWEVQGGKG